MCVRPQLDPARQLPCVGLSWKTGAGPDRDVYVRVTGWESDPLLESLGFIRSSNLTKSPNFFLTNVVKLSFLPPSSDFSLEISHILGFRVVFKII